MKYNDNGTIKELTFKVGDTLPVGTVVEYNGDTVPEGWEEVQSSGSGIKILNLDGNNLDYRVFLRGEYGSGTYILQGDGTIKFKAKRESESTTKYYYGAENDIMTVYIETSDDDPDYQAIYITILSSTELPVTISWESTDNTKGIFTIKEKTEINYGTTKMNFMSSKINVVSQTKGIEFTGATIDGEEKSITFPYNTLVLGTMSDVILGKTPGLVIFPDGTMYVMESLGSGGSYMKLVTLKMGSGEVYVTDTEPASAEDGAIWIDSTTLQSPDPVVVNTLEGNEESKAPSVKAVKNAFINPIYTSDRSVTPTFNCYAEVTAMSAGWGYGGAKVSLAISCSGGEKIAESLGVTSGHDTVGDCMTSIAVFKLEKDKTYNFSLGGTSGGTNGSSLIIKLVPIYEEA